MRLQTRLARLEQTRARSGAGPGLDLSTLAPETLAAMAEAYAETLHCDAPAPDTFQRALLARIDAAKAAGLGMRALGAGDLAALVVAADRQMGWP